MPDFTTPMMKQYMQIKAKYADCLLFFRMGDFYELFLEDAGIGAKVLNITLTSRPKGKDGRIPMAGVPYHAVDVYLNKLVKAGFKVAICEQISLPNKYGIIDREVVRVVTPGTILDENALNKKENNFIISLLIENDTLAITYADLSTGLLGGFEKEIGNNNALLHQALSKINPVECILPDSLYNDPEILKILSLQKDINLYPFSEWNSFSNRAEQVLKEHFEVATLAPFSLDGKALLMQSTASLLGYLKETQRATLSHIKNFRLEDDEKIVSLDRSTVINLELFSTIREHDTKGSLLNVLDQTITAMGGRLLKSWISQPLFEKEEIEKRLDSVQEILETLQLKELIREQLKQIPDIERLLSRLSLGLGNARDIINLRNALSSILKTKENLNEVKSSYLSNSLDHIDEKLRDCCLLILETFVDEPPVDTKSGGIIKPGVSSKLDLLYHSIKKSKEWISSLEKTERERSGISSLKVRFNKVFGFYIEISKSNLNLVPDNYLRKQTLVNGERFITSELKHHEEIIISAEEKINALEYQIFLQTLERILQYTSKIQEGAQSIATIDCLSNFSYLAENENYHRPKLIISGEMEIKNGRHPVVEKLLESGKFVPNDVSFDKSKTQLMLITGPNMAGKSVFIRQVALITLMAQIGCFVPADSATITPVDRIFVRSGASDVITSGLSTFMVEMVETSFILNHATEKSLIVMDEIGRGTSTYDGISIAWAIAEYLVTHYKLPPKTLFATHYHELQQLESQFPRSVKNYSMSVADINGEPIFLYTIVPEAASHSFGVAVAKLAGIPAEIILNASQKLESLESDSTSAITITTTPTDTDTLLAKVIINELASIDIVQMTPLQALNKLADIKSKLKIIQNEHDTLLSTN